MRNFGNFNVCFPLHFLVHFRAILAQTQNLTTYFFVVQNEICAIIHDMSNNNYLQFNPPPAGYIEWLADVEKREEDQPNEIAPLPAEEEQPEIVTEDESLWYTCGQYETESERNR